MWRLVVKSQSTIFAVFVSKFAIRMKNLPTSLRRRNTAADYLIARNDAVESPYTLLPFCAKYCAVASPIPELAPVITTILFFIFSLV